MINRRRRSVATALVILFPAIQMGCRQEPSAVPRPPGASPTPPSAPHADKSATKLPPNHPPITNAPPPAAAPSGASPKPMADVDITGVKFADAGLTVTGVSFSVPQGWVTEDPGMNPGSPALSRKAQFRLPKADNEPEDAEVAITHFPNMKGMDDMNLERWYGQFKQPDGRPTAEVATKAVYALGDVTVTLVEIPGTLLSGGQMMGGAGPEKANYRQLAAIVDHPKGPHFFKLTGPAAVVERYKASAVAFLKSAKMNQ